MFKKVSGGLRGLRGLKGVVRLWGFKRFPWGSRDRELQRVFKISRGVVLVGSSRTFKGLGYRRFYEDSISFKGFKWVLGSEKFKRSLGGLKKGSGGFKEVKI